MPGAAAMAAEAGGRVGAGYVSLFFAKSAPTILTKNTGADFDLTSFLYATGSGTGIVKGYHDGAETHSQTLASTNYNWTTATLNWTGVDEVRFSRAGQWSDFSADSFLVT